MILIEIRDLDGPNIFLLEPAIKIEFAFDGESDIAEAASRLGVFEQRSSILPVDAFAVSVRSWLRSTPAPETTAASMVVRMLETPGRIAVAFSWNHRRFAMAIARTLASIVTGQTGSSEIDTPALRELLASSDPDDLPLMIRDSERRIPVVGITGTNGKTTTTRLLAHMVMATGKHAGWSSSSGVYIDGQEVLHGDYSGPSGGRRVLLDPGVDIAVLETARGGILLRGIAYQSNDVSVFTNVSADHLDLQGVHTVAGLAEVKSIVVKVTRAGGTAVLNADDPLVLSSTSVIQASKLLFSLHPESEAVRSHLATGGTAIVSDGVQIEIRDANMSDALIRLDEIPVTFGGRAPHMVENALAAAGAGIGLGFTKSDIVYGLRTFRNTVDLNLGRLNVYDVDGVTIILDYAHNEVGLALLIDLARTFAGPDGQLAVVIGTAGDRTDHSLSEIGRVAAENADRVIVKDTKRFLRGRTSADLIEKYQAGIRSTGRPNAEVSPGELDGMLSAFRTARPGDVIALMCQEQMNEICSWLKEHGKPLS